MTLRELIKLLRKSSSIEEIDAYRDEIGSLLPQVRQMFDYDQQNSAHQYDLWMHSLHTVVGVPKNIEDSMVYLAALLHDIGKPDCRTAGKRPDDANMHYYGHPQRSMEIVMDEVVPMLLEKGEMISEDEQKRLLYYVGWHDDKVSLRIKHLRQHINMGASLEEFQNLMKLQVADAMAHVQMPIISERAEICNQLAGEYGEELYKHILSGK